VGVPATHPPTWVFAYTSPIEGGDVLRAWARQPAEVCRRRRLATTYGGVPTKISRPAKARTTARRRKIAAGLVAGKAVAEVARETGISRQWASREAQQPETQVELATFLAEHQLALRGLVARAVSVIGEGLGATKVVATKEGGALDLGPDHYARLQAVKRLIELVTAGQARVPTGGDQPSDPTLLTMDRLRAVFERGNRGGPRRA